MTRERVEDSCDRRVGLGMRFRVGGTKEWASKQGTASRRKEDMTRAKMALTSSSRIAREIAARSLVWWRE